MERSRHEGALWRAGMLGGMVTIAGTPMGAGAPPDSLKVAAVQVISDPVKGAVPQAVTYMERAAAEGARLIVFPEYHLGHIAIPGPETETLSAAARRLRLHVVIGCLETMSDGEFFNTALLIDEEGSIAGRYRKVHPAVGEPPHFWPPKGDELEARMTPGTAFPVFDTVLGRIGIFICYDGYFAEVPNILSVQGAEILVWINGRAASVEDFMVRTMVYHTYTAMIATNTAHGRGTTVDQYPATLLAVADAPEVEYISATLDLANLRDARRNSRVFHQRRPDLYTPLVSIANPMEAAKAAACPGIKENP